MSLTVDVTATRRMTMDKDEAEVTSELYKKNGDQ